MARFTLTDIWSDVFINCVPSRYNDRKVDIIEDLKRTKQVNEIRIADQEDTMEKIMREARAKCKDKNALKKIFLDRKSLLTRMSKTQLNIKMLDEWINLIDDQRTFHEIAALGQAVQHFFPPSSKMVDKFDDAIDSMREIQEQTKYLRTTFEGNSLNDATDEELENELEEFMRALDDSPPAKMTPPPIQPAITTGMPARAEQYQATVEPMIAAETAADDTRKGGGPDIVFEN